VMKLHDAGRNVWFKRGVVVVQIWQFVSHFSLSVNVSS
jgi:hypothetical protein